MQNPEFYSQVFQVVTQLFQKSLITQEEKSVIKDHICIENSELMAKLKSEFDGSEPRYKMVEVLRSFVESKRQTVDEVSRKHSNSTDITSLESIWEIDEEMEEDYVRQRR